MEEYSIVIQSITPLTHDVHEYKLEKPPGYRFQPGQATEVAIDKDGWRQERRPFTFTNLPGDDHLEFTIKSYPERNGVTNELLTLKPGDRLVLHDVWGAISYKGEGVFIAGGAGITPFLSIFRDLKTKGKLGRNLLIFANKKKRDIICETELKEMLGQNFINILSEDKVPGYYQGFISEDFLRTQVKNFDQKFYLCGPPPMMDAVQLQLSNLGVGDNALVVEL